METQDLLFELGTEELPPAALKTLSAALRTEFAKGLDEARLQYGELQSFATPRRLAIIAKDCALQQPDQHIERRGPAVQAAFDADGKPSKAAQGFARSCNTTVDQLARLKTDKGEWLSYQLDETGKPAAGLLPDIARTALSRLPIPRRMRWGNSEAQFVRPVHWLLFLHGKQTVACELLGVKAGNTSYGHRFHSPAGIEIRTASEYARKLEQAKVLADFTARRERIRAQVTQSANALDATAELDDALLDEVTALVEWPQPVVAGFEEKYLAVPHEALISTMKKNQKYFPLRDQNGKLMNRFVTIANIESSDPAVIRDGNERVIRPRLADAMFFWEQDGKQKLQDHLESLKAVVFQKKLGSLFDKSERVANLAAKIATHIDGDKALAQRAGQLSRCDLMTATVGEFADMQGIMGRHQARRDGEAEELAIALDEFYMPRYAGDQLPQTKTGIAISLADKLDTLVGIFGIGMKPSGDKDPFALRRAALGALRILKEHALPLDLDRLLHKAVEQLANNVATTDLADQVYDFMLNRLKGIYTDEGVAAETFAAVAQQRPDNIADFDRRIQAVLAFQKLPEAESLAAANKRIRNILKKSAIENPGEVSADLFELDAERTLHDAVVQMAARITPMMLDGDYTNTLKSLAGLRESVDAFFDDVMVMADDDAIRNNRLALLTKLNHLFLQVADISRL